MSSIRCGHHLAGAVASDFPRRIAGRTHYLVAFVGNVFSVQLNRGRRRLHGTVSCRLVAVQKSEIFPCFLRPKVIRELNLASRAATLLACYFSNSVYATLSITIIERRSARTVSVPQLKTNVSAPIVEDKQGACASDAIIFDNVFFSFTRSSSVADQSIFLATQSTQTKSTIASFLLQYRAVTPKVFPQTFTLLMP